jgi:ketosteroid isomerase-like protein
VLSVVAAGPAAASDTSDVAATVKKWVDDFNKGDMKTFLAACAPSASVVDGFPPYAWPTCTDWINAYHANNKVIRLTDGTLWIGKAIYTEVAGDHAYVIYPARFSDREKGKPVVYKGSWTMTLQKNSGRWVFTGSASAWTTTLR